jgi:hypothetical protein
LASDTTREALMSLLNALNIGTWQIEDNTSQNIIRCYTNINILTSLSIDLFNYKIKSTSTSEYNPVLITKSDGSLVFSDVDTSDPDIYMPVSVPPKSESYQKVNIDVNTEPIKVYGMKIIANISTQIKNNLLDFKVSSMSGYNMTSKINLNDYVNATGKQNFIVDFIPEEPFLIDAESYFESLLEAGNTITVLFYYEQMDRREKEMSKLGGISKNLLSLR